MVTLYADGKPIAWADAEKLIPECIARKARVELRNDTGKVIGQLDTIDDVPIPLIVADRSA